MVSLTKAERPTTESSHRRAPGPAGMTVALELSRLQIPIRIIEKTREPATTSSAIGVQARTLELFEQRGLVERMLANGNPGGRRSAGHGLPHLLFEFGFMGQNGVQR
jgi:2-polyprenyl-6-methoxyphenol hydroxylase-like FAD-dependent oxidoreductase